MKDFGELLNVSIHAPVWGATFTVIASKPLFNVSIHAPVWGATELAMLRNQAITVSIHAPVWGATTPALTSKPCLAFQSTHPCGVRRDGVVIKGKLYVSIHAPVWGATIHLVAYIGRPMVSIHAPVWGATARLGLYFLQFWFQSTHPCGVRLRASSAL